MLAFLQMLRERYGGAEVYVKSHCGFSDDDIDINPPTHRSPAISNGS